MVVVGRLNEKAITAQAPHKLVQQENRSSHGKNVEWSHAPPANLGQKGVHRILFGERTKHMGYEGYTSVFCPTEPLNFLGLSKNLWLV